MRAKTKNIALCAVFAAISILLAFLSAVFSSMSLSLLALCGVISAVVLSRCGYRYTLIMYAAVSILSVIFLPDKSCAVLYIFVFGLYPILKALFEKKGKIISWMLKIAAANLLAFATLYVTMSFLANVGKIIIMGHKYFFLFYNIAFVLYDIFLSKFTKYLQSKRFAGNSFN